MINNNAANNLFLNQNVTQTATNYTALANDVIIEVTSTAVPCTITLPSPSVNNSGKFYIIKDISGSAATNNITIVPASGTIDGASSLLINRNYGSGQLFSDGINYFMQGGLIAPIQPTGLARANWVRYNVSPFVPTTTVVAANANANTLLPLTARVNFSSLTSVFTPVNLTVATQSITIVQTGVYYFSFTYTGQANVAGNLISQLVNNGTILETAFTTNTIGTPFSLVLEYTGPLVAGNVIDVRVGNTNTAQQFYCMSFFVVQNPTTY